MCHQRRLKKKYRSVTRSRKLSVLVRPSAANHWVQGVPQTASDRSNSKARMWHNDTSHQSQHALTYSPKPFKMNEERLKSNFCAKKHHLTYQPNHHEMSCVSLLVGPAFTCLVPFCDHVWRCRRKTTLSWREIWVTASPATVLQQTVGLVVLCGLTLEKWDLINGDMANQMATILESRRASMLAHKLQQLETQLGQECTDIEHPQDQLMHRQTTIDAERAARTPVTPIAPDRGNMVDFRLVNKPETITSEAHEWKGWSFQMRQHISAVGEALHVELVNVEANQLRELLMSAMSDAKKKRGRQLTFMLMMHTKDRALQVSDGCLRISN